MVPNPTQLLLAGVIAGIIAPLAAQLIRKQLQWEGDKALYLSLGISLVAGFLAAVLGGVSLPVPGNDPIAFVTALGELLGITFALATVIYKAILEKLQSGLFANPT